MAENLRGIFRIRL